MGFGILKTNIICFITGLFTLRKATEPNGSEADFEEILIIGGKREFSSFSIFFLVEDMIFGISNFQIHLKIFLKAFKGLNWLPCGPETP